MICHYQWYCYCQVVLAPLCRFCFYLLFLPVAECTELVAILTRSLENSSAMMHIEKKPESNLLPSRHQMNGNSPELKKKNNLKHGKSLLMYACAALWKHNENKIRGKVIISLESVSGFLLTSRKCSVLHVC